MKTIRLIGLSLLTLCRLNAQPVAILDDPTLPGYTSTLLQALHQAVRDAGMEPRPIRADEAESDALSPARYRALILPACETVSPAIARRALTFVQEGGPAIFIGGPLLDNPVIRHDGKWMTRTMIDERLAAEPLHHTWPLSPDFPLAAWTHSSNGDAPKGASLTFSPEDRALALRLGELNGWDNFFSPRGMRLFAEGDDLFVFSARPGTPDDYDTVLSIEINERDGSRWIATCPLKDGWKRYTLTLDAFHYWHDSPTPNRGKHGDRLNPKMADRIGFGTSLTHTPTMLGRPLSVRLRDIGSARNPFGSGQLTDDQPLPSQDGVYPRYKLYSARNGGSIIFSAIPRTEGEGFGNASPWRFIPLKKLIPRMRPDILSIPEWILLEQRPGQPARRLAGFGYRTDRYLRSDNLMEPDTFARLSETLRILLEMPILYEAGTDRFTYWKKEPVRIGARILHPPGRKPEPVTVEFRLFKDGQQEPFAVERRMTDAETLSFEWGKPLKPGEYQITIRLLDNPSRGTSRTAWIQHTFAVLAPTPDPPDAFIRVSGGEFTLHGKPWRPIGVNYWPRYIAGMNDADFWAGWMRDGYYAPAQIDRDLNRMAEIGINMVSIQAPPLEHARNLVDFLRRCRKRSIYVNLFHGAASPVDFKRRELADFLTAARLPGNAQLFAYDTIWEPGNHLFRDDRARSRWDAEWRGWINDRYGSVERAERDWGLPARRNGQGEVVSPPDTWFKEDGPWRIQMAAYRRFMDTLTSRLWNRATRELRELDPNHLISFRQGNTLPHDFALTGPVRHIDFICPEGYSVPNSDAGENAIGWITRFVDATTGGKPIIWSEFGVSVWDNNRLESTAELVARQYEYHERFYKIALFAGANGTAPWWWPGGYRVGEQSDYGIIDPNGWGRLAFSTIRRYAPLFREYPKPQPQYWTRFDRDAHAGGYWYEAFHAGAEAFGKTRRKGALLGIRLDGFGMTSADCPMTAVGNVPCDGTNPPKYLDAECDTVTADGVTHGKRRYRARFGNLGMAEWLPASVGTGGCRLTVRNPAGNLLAAAPLETRTPRLAAASFTFEIPATESTLLLRLEAQNRTPFGETKRVGENEKMSGR
ncbi:MAG: hypothetical protein J6336_01120 [Kiritimatiellae bacterium]|nr:hypothetical protein [Kiritimatiellia bacterium]